MGIKFLNGKILHYFSKVIFKYDKLVLKIFGKIIPFIPYANIKQCFYHHAESIIQEKAYPISIKIMTSIIDSKQPDQFYLEILN